MAQLVSGIELPFTKLEFYLELLDKNSIYLPFPKKKLQHVVGVQLGMPNNEKTTARMG